VTNEVEPVVLFPILLNAAAECVTEIGYTSMLRRGRQRKYLKKHWRAIQSHLALFLASQNPEELHHLRLEVKRISAYISLLRHCSCRNDLRSQFEPLRQLFKTAGKIRSAQINLSLADSNYLADEEFRRVQQDIIITQTYDLRIGKYASVIRSTKRRWSKRISTMHDRCILMLFRRELNAISEMLSKDWSAEELHLCRKRIKRILYNFELLNKPLTKRLNLNIEYLNHLQDSIGKWHDAATSLKTFSAFSQANPQTISHLTAQVEELIAINRDLTNDFRRKFHRGKS